jgi:hypothetical protein
MEKGKKSCTHGQEVNIGTKRTKNAEHQEKHTQTKSRVDGR